MMSEDELRRAAVERLRVRRQFWRHLIVYVVVNAFLGGVWYFSGRGLFWPVFVIGGWGIGLAANAWRAFGEKPISEAEIQAEIDRQRGSGS